MVVVLGPGWGVCPSAGNLEDQPQTIQHPLVDPLHFDLYNKFVFGDLWAYLLANKYHSCLLRGSIVAAPIVRERL